ncbi:osmotically inducible protein OsmC [Algibacter amylolyticus]|uniref:Osmotically inducible protein OsmC n=1 Tax=Algibacter amylolyticus TaxID=1608400 RepID=A0A5M7B5I0_9FLAO|nr:OsmC family protein [Algibacter amylolyticus]KAA5823628.1 osmotically inducible protein OsmC [Algibacter amylolyticus]MBB5267788.1 peroxiredoxin-like protein [Algibacter amylolyticus]TSJ74116.1 osmotically inducible protein OsmC [Algibacter amylolyticus]
MSFKHTFKAEVNWQIGDNETTANPRGFSRNHEVTIANKNTPLEVSAAKPFRGDDTRYNPEDLLLSALASCHMMSYLYVCSQNNIEVVSFTDTAEAILDVEPSGSGHFSKVTLKPVVTIKDDSQVELAKALHDKANSLCFIANSCNFPIKHYVEILVTKD